MTSKERVRGFTASEKVAQPLPFFMEFASFLEDAFEADQHVSTVSLHSSYQCYVKYRVGHTEGSREEEWEEEVELALHKRAFGVTLRRYCAGRFHSYSNTPRGYYVKLRRDYMRRKPAEEIYPVPADPSTLITIVKCSIKRAKGRGAFAATNIRANQTLCEYRGRRLSLEDGERKEMEYAAQGMSMTMLYNYEPNFCVDGHAHEEEGQEFRPDENIAALLNTKKVNPNCAMVFEGTGKKRRFFLRTRREVAAGCELVWFYGDTRRDLEGFMYK